MMKTKNQSKFLIICFSFLFLLCAIVGVFAFKANASTGTFIFSDQLESKYRVNQVIAVPTATVDGVQADFLIQLPDGNCSTNQNLHLEKPGSYSIEWTANVNGEIIRETKTFIVTGDLFTVEGIGTSEYKTIDYVNSSGDKTASGQMFTLNNGDSITYNDVVDLSKFGPNETLFKMSNIVSNIGESDINQYDVSLIDAYDESNSVNIRFKRSMFASSNDYTITYIDAEFNGKYCGGALRSVDWKGDTIDTNGAYYVDGLRGMQMTVYNDENKNGAHLVDRTEGYYYAYINHERAGANVTSSMTGGTLESPKNNGAYWTGIWYDVETNILYAVCKYGANDNQVTRTIIADLENADIFGEKFHGFTNNKVKIKITPTIFNKGSCKFFIQEFAGQKITEDAVNGFISSYSPEVNIDFGEYNESNIPNVRKGSEFKVFEATAFDLFDGDIPVKTSVYYGYNNLVKQQIQLTNGYFTANHLGDYTIVYQATNSAGKTTEKTITVKSVITNEQLGVNIYGEPDYTVSVPSGKQVKVMDNYQIVNAFGNSKLNAKATLKSDNTVCFELNEDNAFTFVPVYSGEYEIVYTVQDYSNEVIVKRTLNVVNSNNVYYVIKDAFPEYLIQNGVYNLNIVNSYALNTGKPVLTKTALSIDPQNGGALIPISSTMRVESDYVRNGVVKLVYYPENASNSETFLVKEIPVIDAGLYTDYLDKSKYLVSTNGQFEFTSTADSTECEVVKLQNGSAKFTFANYLNVNPFKIRLKALVKGDEFVAFDKLNVYLYDPLNLNNYIVSSLVRTSEGWFVNVNGQGQLKLSNTWGGADDEFYVNFSAADGKIVLNNYFKYTGIKFFGTDTVAEFTRGAKLEVEIIGSDGCDGVIINSINDVVLDKYGDYSESKIDFTNDNNAGEHSIGEIITLLPFSAYDVFAPHLDVTIQVLLVSGAVSNFINDINGERLVACDASKSYQFEIKEYGTYNIQVSAKDSMNSDNNTVWDYSIVVVDYTKPSVEITNKKTSYSVGDKFSVPTFKTTSSQYSWLVVLKLPSAKIVSVNETTEYKFTEKGVYSVSLLVYDNNYNITEISYMVKVK